MPREFKSKNIGEIVVAGIDPGKTGAYCFMDSDNNIECFRFDEDWRVNFMRFYQRKPKLVVLEKAQSMPKQGVKSMFTYGGNYGGWQAALAIGKFPFQLVHPKTWQACVLRDLNKGDKMKTVHFCNKRFPGFDFLKTHNGITDAICMALYAKHLLK